MPERRVPRSASRREVLIGLGALAPALAACGQNGGPLDSSGTAEGATTGSGGSHDGTSGAGTTSSAGTTSGTGVGGQSAGDAGTGGSPGDAGMGSAGAGGSDAGDAGDAGGSVGMLVSPPWTNVPIQDSTNADMPKMLACNVVTKHDAAGQGPFFIHELEKDDDVSLVRQDIRGKYNASAQTGVDMELFVRIIDKNKSDAACGALVPVPDVDVYLWHTDAQGFYSGFGTRGGADEQKPDAPYMGVPSTMNLETTERFCRGLQTTNADGVVGFLSVFPGWYNGRDLHIHIVCFKRGSKSRGRVEYAKSIEPLWIFTTQFYFDPAFGKSIHEAYDPYKARTKLSAYAGALAADEAGNSGRHCTATKVGDKVIAQIQMVVDPT